MDHYVDTVIYVVGPSTVKSGVEVVCLIFAVAACQLQCSDAVYGSTFHWF